MSAGISVTCPHCGHQAKLKSAAALGREAACRACGEPFLLTADAPEESDEFDDSFDDDFPDSFDDRPLPARSGRGDRGRSDDFSSRSAAGVRQVERRGSSGGSSALPWIIAAVVGLPILVCCGGALLLPAIQIARDAERLEEIQELAQGPPTALPPATKAQAEELGEQIVVALNANDRGRVDGLLDADTLFELSFGGLGMTGLERRQSLREFETTSDDIVDGWTELTQNGGSARLLGASERDGSWAAVVRVIYAEGGPDYFAFYPTPDGRIADAYPFAVGERLSTVMRRGMGAWAN
ncbi:MAG: DUF2614 family zinc ribbon-containing protein, partial [Planctomycetota bacterium]